MDNQNEAGSSITQFVVQARADLQIQEKTEIPSSLP